ncbi:hypothetical protein O181_108590 [Austropuccinia psidii MF-1]|uniref:CCHC-type domain-containing protein n=1 Tax=Austropuccinia psidii MF-1 TaxID=1389203 RepID=A0A9Q3JSN8_9BASI|nr:hypothetical protein [Austropuccinia psidii MF-1]
MKILKKCGDKSKEAFKTNTSNNNEQRKCHKCGRIGHLANHCLKKAKINEIVETEDHNEKEKESHSEKDTEEAETSESDEINRINAQTNNIDIIYEVLHVSSNLPQAGTSETNLTNAQDVKLYITKPEKVIGYTDGKSSIIIVMVDNQEAKVNLDTGAYFTFVGESYLKTIVPDWQETLIPIQGVKFSSASESMKPLGIIDLTPIFPHPSQCVRIKVAFVVMDKGTIIKNEEKSPEKKLVISEQLKEAEFNQDLAEKMKEKLIDLLFKYNNAFATDKEPLGAIIGHEVDIIINVENSYPPLLRRPAYPASPRARQALEVHIKELMYLGVLRKVGHNEYVEVTKPVIIAWHN